MRLNWLGLLGIRAGVGLALDIVGLVSAVVADSPGDTWPFGLVTLGVTVSGLTGILYARHLESSAQAGRSACGAGVAGHCP